jgi:hypothetical protein
LVVALPLVSLPAGAMSIRTERALLARGAAGAALYEIREFGPEGGGALSYRVELRAADRKTNRPREQLDFKVSSDFSPGGTEQPQTVSAAVCAERLAGLGAAVAEHKIPGVTLHPERCKQENREGLVVVAQPPARRP